MKGMINGLLSVNTSYVPALMARAQLYLQRRDFASATTDYTAVLQEWPDFALAQKHLATLLAENPDQIEVAFQLALKARNLLQDDPELGETLGEISYKRGDFPYAIQCFQESARKQSLPGPALFYFGMAQFRMSQDGESRKTLEKAVSVGLQEPLLGQAQTVIVELQNRSGM
jgi:tetratricopeptide (TPR) repeat protein